MTSPLSWPFSCILSLVSIWWRLNVALQLLHTHFFNDSMLSMVSSLCALSLYMIHLCNTIYKCYILLNLFYVLFVLNKFHLHLCTGCPLILICPHVLSAHLPYALVLSCVIAISPAWLPSMTISQWSITMPMPPINMPMPTSIVSSCKIIGFLDIKTSHRTISP